MKPIITLLLTLIPFAAIATDTEMALTLRHNQFAPAELHVPSGKRIKLLVDNQDASAEEFESYELNREKVIPAQTHGYLFIGPLAPGRYPFFGDFHPQTARGVVIAE